MILDIIKTVLEKMWSGFSSRRNVQVLVHMAFFNSGAPCFFINVANLSKDREVEITHVWFDFSPQISVLQPERPLPKRLKPDESWETWIEVHRMPSEALESESIYHLARVRLTSGRIIKSRRNLDVPDKGTVPGGPPPTPGNRSLSE
jgi:hypothetical protein